MIWWLEFRRVVLRFSRLKFDFLPAIGFFFSSDCSNVMHSFLVPWNLDFDFCSSTRRGSDVRNTAGIERALADVVKAGTASHPVGCLLRLEAPSIISAAQPPRMDPSFQADLDPRFPPM